MKEVGVFLLVTLVALPIVYYNLPSNPYITDDKPPEKPYYPRLTFSIFMLKQLQNEKPNESVLYSPHSLYETLLLSYFAASGETEKQLKNLLGLNWIANKSDVEYTFKSKNEHFNRLENGTIEFSSVNKLFVTTELKIRYKNEIFSIWHWASLKIKKFWLHSDSVADLLGSDNIESLNFSEEPDQCTAHINNFVEEITKKKIKNLIPPNVITSGTKFVIANAVYFKGQWV